MAQPLPMPIHLEDVPTSTRPMVFVVDARGIGEPLDLFGNGLHLVLGNYLTARSVRGGIAALCGDQTLLHAVRALADTIYAAAGVTVDTSATNVDAPQVIAGVYPDATFVVVEPVPPDVAAKVALIERARVVRVARDELGPLLATFDVGPGGVARSYVKSPEATLVEPVFVVGCPRSGTTWVRNLLAAHPGLNGPDQETALFVAARGVVDNAAVERAVGRPALLDAVRAFVATLCGSYAGARFLEKTPIHALHLDFITELFPDAWIVGVHRDGRDVVRSVLEVEMGVNDVAEAASGWALITRTVHEFAQSSPRARDERYEDWLDGAVIGAVDVLAWLGLPPDEAVIDELRRRAPLRVSQYNTVGSVGGGKWRDLPARDLRTIYREAGECLVEMGYDVRDDDVTARPSLLARFRPGARRQ